jgi:hypothetical protein
MGQLKPQKLIFSLSWRLEISDPGLVSPKGSDSSPSFEVLMGPWVWQLHPKSAHGAFCASLCADFLFL